MVSTMHGTWSRLCLSNFGTLLDIVFFVLVYISYVQYCVTICMRAK